MPVIVDPDIDRRAHQESGNILNGMLSAIAHQAQISGVQQLLGVGAATGPQTHLPDHAIPEFAVNRNVRHGSPEPGDYSGRNSAGAKSAPWGMQKTNAFRASMNLL